jgi:hypothetical protein
MIPWFQEGDEIGDGLNLGTKKVFELVAPWNHLFLAFMNHG